MKISVIVPVYRAEAYLRQCVDSIAGQTYGDLEILLVDDGSPDHCPEICDEYAGKDKRIKVIHKKNGGAVSAWQAGVRNSSGEYLHFVDSDDWIELHMLEEMARHITGKKKEIICCNYIIEKEGRAVKEKHRLSPGVYEGEVLEKQVKSQLLGKEFRAVSMSRCMKLFSRELIEKNLCFCEGNYHLLEDVTIILPALLDCARLVIMEEAYYYHYLFRAESTVHKYDSGMYEEIQRGYEKLLYVFSEKSINNGAAQVQNEYLFLLFWALKNEIRGNQAGWPDRVRYICRDEKSKATLSLALPRLTQKANQILYMVLKWPYIFVILIARGIFFVYDKGR